MHKIAHDLTDDENPEGIATDLKDRLPSGGYLLSANFLSGDDSRAPQIERVFLEGGLGTERFRTREQPGTPALRGGVTCNTLTSEALRVLTHLVLRKIG